MVDKHGRDLRRVLDVLAKEKLVSGAKKCHFFATEVEWVGFILGKGVRRPAPGKLMAIEKWSAPTNVTALRAFLGFTNYYSSFVEK